MKAGKLVLEVGGGHNPSPSADVLVDKDLADDAERGGALVRDRPLVIADGEALPFRDNAFGYSIGRQVMEHMNDISSFFGELMRVSPGGYLSSPSALRELVFGWPYHRWFITQEGHELVCARKADMSSPGGVAAHYFARSNRHFRKFLRSLPPHLMHVQYRWNESIRYRVVDEPALPDLLSETAFEDYLERRPTHSNLKAFALRLLPESMVQRVQRVRCRAQSATRRAPVDLNALLACPACKSDVELVRDAYECCSCERVYPIREGVPHFLLAS